MWATKARKPCWSAPNLDVLVDSLLRAWTLERIYIGRRFKNDTERLFEMYTQMTAQQVRREKASQAQAEGRRRVSLLPSSRGRIGHR